MSVVTKALSLARVKGRGWLPSTQKASDRVFEPRMSAPHDGAPALRACVPTIYSQGATSSCVAQAIAGAIGTRERWLGLPYEVARDGIARRDLYYRARYTHGDQKIDGGTYIPVALDQVRKHGAVLERDFPWSELWINRGAPAAMLHTGYERSQLVYERIVAAGDKKLEALAAAFAEGLPVVFGTQLPASFVDHVGDGVYMPDPLEPLVGGHAMYAVEIDPMTGNVLLVNSWGRRWGMGGMGWMHADWVQRAWRDMHVMRGWKRVANAERMVSHVAA